MLTYNNTGANFTAYQELKKFAHRKQPELSDLPTYQHMIIGLISGAMGPFSNAPIDTIKTRRYFTRSGFAVHFKKRNAGLQKAMFPEGTPAMTRVTSIASEMWRQEGVHSFYKGITPRVLRVAPGQAIVFAVYERVRRVIERVKEVSDEDDRYSE